MNGFKDVCRVWEKFQMTDFTMPNNITSMKYALKALLMLGSPMEMGMASELRLDVWRGQENVSNH